MTVNWQITVQKGYPELAEATIDEYLRAARVCLDYRSETEKRFGAPVALLLFATVEAIGHFLCGETVLIDGRRAPITKGEPFRVLNHPIFGETLSHAQIKNLENAFRNPLAHNGLMARENILVTVDGSTNIPALKVEPSWSWIELNAFYRLVAKAWQRFDKSKIRAAVERGQVPNEKRL